MTTTYPPSSPLRQLSNDFTLHSPIAKGSFGQVQRATSQQTGSPAAVKTSNAGGAKQLNFEIGNLIAFQNVSHSLRLRLGISGEYPIVVSDLIPGKDVLRSLLAKHNALMPFDKWVTITKQLLEFLQGAHEMDWFHGDLKGDNVIYEDAARHLTVLDYNGAGKENVRSASQVLQGAPYKSPEIVMLGEAKKELDIWSAGCMLFRFLTGDELFPVSFTPNPSDTHISDNQHLHMMVDMLGMPSLPFLQKCKKAGKYFKLDPIGSVTFLKPLKAVDVVEWSKIKSSYRAFSQGKPVSNELYKEMDMVYWKQESWQLVVNRVLDQRQVPHEQKQQVIELLSKMVQYENRASAVDLLTNRLFESDVHFHLVLPSDFGAKSTDKIYFYRGSDVKLDQFPGDPSILIDRQIRVRRECYHLPKDPDNRYFIVVQRGDDKILVESMIINPNDRMVLQEENGRLKLLMSSQSEAVSNVVQDVLKRPIHRDSGGEPSIQKKIKREQERNTSIAQEVLKPPIRWGLSEELVTPKKIKREEVINASHTQSDETDESDSLAPTEPLRTTSSDQF